MRFFHGILLLFLLLTISSGTAAAIDESDSDWVIPTLNFTEMESGSNRFTVYGTMTAYELDENGMGLYDYTRDLTTGYDIPYGNYPVISKSSTRWECSLAPSISGSAPYSHYESDQNTYYNLYEYTQYSLKGSQAVFLSDFYLDPGYYEISANFSIDQYVMFPSSYSYFRPAVYSVGFLGDRKSDVQLSCIPSSCNFTFELKERSRLYFSCTPNSLMQPYDISSSGSWPFLRYWLNVYSFQYRTIDPLQVAALDAATTDAQNSLQQSNDLESQWVGSMSENFAALDLANFSWDSGIVGAFSLISDIFMRLWAAMGKYNILYIFPLTLGVVLLLIGRIAKSDRSSWSGKSDPDA